MRFSATVLEDGAKISGTVLAPIWRQNDFYWNSAKDIFFLRKASYFFSDHTGEFLREDNKDASRLLLCKSLKNNEMSIKFSHAPPSGRLSQTFGSNGNLHSSSFFIGVHRAYKNKTPIMLIISVLPN